MILSPGSERTLLGVHPQLANIVRRAARLMDGDLGFRVTCGLRTIDEQARLYRIGATRTMRSRHITGHAVDLAAEFEGAVRWDWPLYARLNKVMQQAAGLSHLDLEWGGDWRTFKDGPHWQLPRTSYPDNWGTVRV